MNYECFEVDVKDRVAHIQLSRPDKRNSMIRAFWTELPKLVKQLDSDGEVRAIVISSTGPHFSSGMDVSVFEGTPATQDKKHKLQRPARMRDTILELQNSFTVLEQARIPVLAAVQGGCIGAGVDLITACDMRYATRDAFFTIYETNLAMTADVGTFPRICKLMPDGMVRELAYTGRPMSTKEAMSHGLVNAVYDTQEMMVESVLEIASLIASKAPLAVYGCKQMILHARDNTVADTLKYVALWNTSFLQREEITEAMAASDSQRQGDFVSLPPSSCVDDEALDLN